MDTSKRIAKNIRKHRKGMSLKTIAQKAGIPVGTIEYIYYPRRKNPRIDTLIAIAKALGVSLDKLVK
jgi:transcriptional regulator with XRE-family HTH domain